MRTIIVCALPFETSGNLEEKEPLTTWKQQSGADANEQRQKHGKREQTDSQQQDCCGDRDQGPRPGEAGVLGTPPPGLEGLQDLWQEIQLGPHRRPRGHLPEDRAPQAQSLRPEDAASGRHGSGALRQEAAAARTCQETVEFKAGDNVQEMKKQRPDWRKRHEEFINTIRAAKQLKMHLAAGGKVSDLPPPPPLDTSDYIQCPHCMRRFNQTAAARHIPLCADMIHNKPRQAGPPKIQRKR